MLPVILEVSALLYDFDSCVCYQHTHKSSFWEKETSVALSLNKSLPTSEGVPSSSGGGAESLDQAPSETPATALAIEGDDNGEIMMDVSEMLVHKHFKSRRWKTCSVSGLSVRKGSRVPSE